jgi:sensor c-di-GMP phosphodiesterase-like protein
VRFLNELGELRSPGDEIAKIEQDPAALAELMDGIFRCIATDIIPLWERFPSFYVGVNTPPIILGTGVPRDLAVKHHLDRHAHRIVVELTERQAMTELGRDAVRQARAIGLRIAVDDFGTGESGLKQLLGLEVDILKIDKSVVDPLLKDASAERLLRGIVALAGALRVKLVAEGVERPEQAVFLRAAGVDSGQGWLWSRALPAADLAAILEKGRIPSPDALRSPAA